MAAMPSASASAAPSRRMSMTDSRRLSLADERAAIQARSFMRWCNAHLRTKNKAISDLFTDLRDGSRLLLLLEILSGEDLPKPARGRWVCTLHSFKP